MIIHWIALLLSLLFAIINANINQVQHSVINIAIAEHEPNDIIVNDPLDQSREITTEKTLIRVIRVNDNSEKSITNDRQRRQVVDTDEILGMAKTVAITVFIIISLCIVCCIITIIFICVKCCCGSNNNRKRNQGFTTVPQPIIIHTGTSNYPPQFHHQQASPPITQTWNPENHPMLPQPSAPPRPNDDFHMERPPPYEKICTSR